MAKTIVGETKRKPKKGKRTQSPKEPKRRGLVPLVVGSYFTHSPFNVMCMQIVKSNNNGRS
jgi:hypothetical protein